MENLYSWLFWYNHNEDLWYAIHRDHYIDFFASKESRKEDFYYKSKKIQDLIDYIRKKS